MAEKILKEVSLYDRPRGRQSVSRAVSSYSQDASTLGHEGAASKLSVSMVDLSPKSNEISHMIDYLVVGAMSSARWNHEEYGAKIEAAVVERHIHGKPAIISEEHWLTHLEALRY